MPRRRAVGVSNARLVRARLPRRGEKAMLMSQEVVVAGPLAFSFRLRPASQKIFFIDEIQVAADPQVAARSLLVRNIVLLRDPLWAPAGSYVELLPMYMDY